MKNTGGCIFTHLFQPQQGPAGKGRHPAHLFTDQNNPCAAVGSICHSHLCAVGGRDLSLVVGIAQVGAVWAGRDPSSASPFRMLETMGVSSRETPVEFWVRHVCVLGCKGR